MIKVAGNHDPDCSQLYHLELADGEVLVTHGDVLYPEIAPWSRFAAQFQKMIQTGLNELQNPGRHSLEHLLEINKKVARKILSQPHFYFPTNEGFFRHLLRYLWPPYRILRILGSWRHFPCSAAELAENHWPGTGFVVVGHTHYPGIWSCRDRRIINTGSFLPGLGRLLVDIHQNHLEVRKIRRIKDAFHPGRMVRRYELIVASSN